MSHSAVRQPGWWPPWPEVGRPERPEQCGAWAVQDGARSALGGAQAAGLGLD